MCTILPSWLKALVVLSTIGLLAGAALSPVPVSANWCAEDDCDLGSLSCVSSPGSETNCDADPGLRCETELCD